MRRQGLTARRIKRRNSLTRPDKAAPKFPDLLRRDFAADRHNARWVGDMTQIPTRGPMLYLATVIDLSSRHLGRCRHWPVPRRRAGLFGDHDGSAAPAMVWGCSTSP